MLAARLEQTQLLQQTVATRLFLGLLLQQAVVEVVVVVQPTLAAQAVVVAVKETIRPAREHQDKAILAVQVAAAQPVEAEVELVLSVATVLDQAVRVAQEQRLQSQERP